MEEEQRDRANDTECEKEERSDFGYMDELSNAYKEYLAGKRARTELSEEKKAYIASAERKIGEMCASIATRAPLAEVKELAFMAKESAEQIIRHLEEADGITSNARDYAHYPLPALLSRCVLLANRALNSLIRAECGAPRSISLLLAQLSALYAIAAIR